MEKNGFTFIGDGSEERVIRYELTREAFEKIKPQISHKDTEIRLRSPFSIFFICFCYSVSLWLPRP
jgi:hypothetical protein